MANYEMKHVVLTATEGDNQHKVMIMEGSAFEKIADFKAFTFEELQTATDNFSPSNMLGQGSYGQVFHGLLGSKHVAVKRLHPNDYLREEDKEEFIREIRHLGSVSHQNILPLMGFCLEAPTPLLVTEKLHSLHKALYDGTNHLNWTTRLQIALGVAKGLAYLHTGARRPMLHCDINPGNILLDPENLTRAYIADFGVVHLLAGHQPGESGEEVEGSWYYGTFGYWAPEARAEKRLSTKSDVYSFGKLLYALLSGNENVHDMPPCLIQKSKPSRGVVVYLRWFASLSFFNLLRSNMIEATVAPAVVEEVRGSARALIEVSTMLKLIVLCTRDKAEQRPSMERVRLELESATSCSISWAVKTPVFVGLKICRWVSYLALVFLLVFLLVSLVFGLGSVDQWVSLLRSLLVYVLLSNARKMYWKTVALMYWSADEISMLESKPIVAVKL